MFKRQTSGSVVCVSCGYLVGVKDERCYHCGRRNPGLWGFAPAIRRLGHDLGFVPFVTGVCVVTYVLSLATSGPNIQMDGMFGFLGPDTCSLLSFGGSGAYAVFERQRWWTVLSAAWLHAGLLHILFNLLWIRQLGPAVAELYGPGRMVIIYTAGAIVGFAASSTGGLAVYLGYLPRILGGAGLTVGASAPIFGLLGALIYYGRRSGSSLVRAQAMSWAVPAFLFGFLMPGIDNYAHGGGFLGGWLAARLLDPLRPEHIKHMVTALGCLVFAVLTIIVSLLLPIGPPICE